MKLATDKIVSLSLHEEVRERLRSRIVDRILKPGDHIDEIALAEEFGISRTPLREALKVLQSEGLITMIPRRGCFVAELSSHDLDDIYNTVAALEGQTARVAAQALSEKDLKRLRQLQDRMESAATAGDYDAYRPVNREVHEILQTVAANSWLNDIVANLRRVLMLHRYVTIWLPERLHQSVGEHRDLLVALEARDADAAEHVMRTHVLNQREALRRMNAQSTSTAADAEPTSITRTTKRGGRAA
ncbi:MAG: putative gntR-family transcriptional regulator [Noviherbaspirillum sp.]|nr:putative gntR-family transcriptional regulator [Noviherbaspirillum sp.]